MDKARVKESLNKAINLHKLYKSSEYQNTLLPALKELSQVKALNPLDFPTRDEFTRQTEIMFAQASAFKQVMDLLESSEGAMNKWRKQLDAPDKDWSVGNGQG